MQSFDGGKNLSYSKSGKKANVAGQLSWPGMRLGRWTSPHYGGPHKPREKTRFVFLVPWETINDLSDRVA